MYCRNAQHKHLLTTAFLEVDVERTKLKRTAQVWQDRVLGDRSTGGGDETKSCQMQSHQGGCALLLSETTFPTLRLPILCWPVCDYLKRAPKLLNRRASSFRQNDAIPIETMYRHITSVWMACVITLQTRLRAAVYPPGIPCHERCISEK